MVNSGYCLLGFALAATAFPQIPQKRQLDLGGLLGGLEGALSGLEGQLTGLALGIVHALGESPSSDKFDAAAQRIDVSGSHAWKPPGHGDDRGPCPGLNALANHGYLPRNGRADILRMTSAVHEVYGMGLDLAAVLSVYGAVLDGPLLGWSIGGKPHTGISGSHNNYETDSSPTRGDLNQYGSNEDLVLSQFKELYDMQPNASTANYDLSVIGAFRAARFKQSVNQNPLFFYGPFTGVAVSQAAFTFIYRLMANHTAEEPQGRLDQDVLKSFFSVSGESDSLQWTPGHERIPNNWYRRATNDTYGLKQLSTDIGTIAHSYPFIAQPGCNNGTLGSFTPIETDGTDAAGYDFTNPLHAVCFGIASAERAAQIPIVSAVVEELLIPIQNLLGCPTVPSTGKTIGATCPGYSLFGGPTGPKAPTAIQS